MTADYDNLSDDRATMPRINDLPSSDERRGIKGSQESPRRTNNPSFSCMDSPDFIRRERKAKVSRVMTRASMRMIDPSVPRAERNKRQACNRQRPICEYSCQPHANYSGYSGTPRSLHDAGII